MPESHSLAAKIEQSIKAADAATIARTDQQASTLRDFFAQRGYDLTDVATADIALLTVTFVYGMQMAGHSTGAIEDTSFAHDEKIIASVATALTTLRGSGEQLALLPG